MGMPLLSAVTTMIFPSSLAGGIGRELRNDSTVRAICRFIRSRLSTDWLNPRIIPIVSFTREKACSTPRA